MCMVYSNGRHGFVCSQDEEEKQPKQRQKKVASGAEVHWEGQVVLVSKTSYL